MSRVKVKLGERSYEIVIGSGSLKTFGNDLTDLGLGRKCVIITDENVGRLYANHAMASLTDAGYIAGEIRLPQGEENKSLKNVERCYHTMLSLGLDRGSFVVALGGGLIGDLAGFVAATYMRGIPFIQAPTTLLADVDASIGGKTGVNLHEGKNLVGAFHQPRAVFIDTSALKTLEKRDVVAGFVEIIKHALIKDSEFYAFLRRNAARILKLAARMLEETIEWSCRIKAAVVEEDEKESGNRALLNLGHTLGHAIESLSVEMGKPYRHGEAVSIGIALSLDVSVALGRLASGVRDEVLGFMEECSLPLTCEFIDPEQVMDRMKSDKKHVSGELRFIILDGIGSASIESSVDPDVLLEVMKKRLGVDG